MATPSRAVDSLEGALRLLPLLRCSNVIAVKARKFAAFSLVVGLALGACTEKPTPTPSPPAEPSVPSAPAQPSADPSGTAAAPVPAKGSLDTWLVVTKGGVELGVIELRAGKPPKLALETENADSAALRDKLTEISGPEGIGLNMHLPSPTGTGRGPYGTRIIKSDDKLYRHAVTEALEPEFTVREVPELVDRLPPENLRRLRVRREGKEVGSLDFSSKPPKLSARLEESDGRTLRNDWERLQERPELKLRYRLTKDGVATLVVARAKPGDVNYGQTVALTLILLSSYQTRYAYYLEYS